MTILIAITGASGSGKTTLAEKLKSQLGSKYNVDIISMDDYYNAQDDLPMVERERTNYDQPAAFDLPLLATQLEQIKAGQHVEKPNYDFTVHTRCQTTDIIEPLDVCIIEGILPICNDQLAQSYDLKFYLDIAIETCLERRKQRDIVERGRTEECVERQFKETVIPGYKQYIVAQKEQADICLTGQESLTTVAKEIEQLLP